MSHEQLYLLMADFSMTKQCFQCPPIKLFALLYSTFQCKKRQVRQGGVNHMRIESWRGGLGLGKTEFIPPGLLFSIILKYQSWNV